MDISAIEKHKEEIASKVHDAWWDEKSDQGFHSPMDCNSKLSQEVRNNPRSGGSKFLKYCDKCHADMYPYGDLPENVKDYDRATVSAVLKAISQL